MLGRRRQLGQSRLSGSLSSRRSATPALLTTSLQRAPYFGRSSCCSHQANIDPRLPWSHGILIQNPVVRAAMFKALLRWSIEDGCLRFLVQQDTFLQGIKCLADFGLIVGAQAECEGDRCTFQALDLDAIDILHEI